MRWESRIRNAARYIFFCTQPLYLFYCCDVKLMLLKRGELVWTLALSLRKIKSFTYEVNWAGSQFGLSASSRASIQRLSHDAAEETHLSCIHRVSFSTMELLQTFNWHKQPWLKPKTHESAIETANKTVLRSESKNMKPFIRILKIRHNSIHSLVCWLLYILYTLRWSASVTSCMTSIYRHLLIYSAINTDQS